MAVFASVHCILQNLTKQRCFEALKALNVVFDERDLTGMAATPRNPRT